MRTVHLVAPAGVADPTRPSGGNTYHRRIGTGLAALGWATHERLVEGSWPGTKETLVREMAAALGQLPDGSAVLVDGLVALPVPEVIVAEADRLRLVVVVHLPLGLDSEDASRIGSAQERRSREAAVLSVAAAVVTTSRWTRDWLLATYRLDPHRIHVVAPGVDVAEPTNASPAGDRLLCVAAVSEAKGHDTLVAALASIADLTWSCRCVGSTDIDPTFAESLRGRVADTGLGGRLVFTGPFVGGALTAEYAAADLLIAPSRTETYGMVVTEALGHAIPVIAADVGGLPEALGCSPGGLRPGVLVPSADPSSLATALRAWLTDDRRRTELRAAALARRNTLRGWSDTASRLSDVVSEVLSEAAA